MNDAEREFNVDRHHDDHENKPYTYRDDECGGGVYCRLCDEPWPHRCDEPGCDNEVESCHELCEDCNNFREEDDESEE